MSMPWSVVVSGDKEVVSGDRVVVSGDKVVSGSEVVDEDDGISEIRSV